MYRIDLLNIGWNCHNGFIAQFLCLELKHPNVDSALLGVNFSPRFFYLYIFFIEIIIFDLDESMNSLSKLISSIFWSRRSIAYLFSPTYIVYFALREFLFIRYGIGAKKGEVSSDLRKTPFSKILKAQFESTIENILYFKQYKEKRKL